MHLYTHVNHLFSIYYANTFLDKMSLFELEETKMQRIICSWAMNIIILDTDIFAFITYWFVMVDR